MTIPAILKHIAKALWKVIVRQKYVSILVFGLSINLFFDENSVYNYIRLKQVLADKEQELQEYEENYEADSIRLSTMKNSRKNVEHIARELYFMKRPNEDVFVIKNK